jgi:hypothetical protein
MVRKQQEDNNSRGTAVRMLTFLPEVANIPRASQRTTGPATLTEPAYGEIADTLGRRENK